MSFGENKMNKKGSGLLDIYFIFIFLWICILVGAIAVYLSTSFNIEWQEQKSTIVGEKSQLDSQSYTSSMQMTIDGAIVLWFFILYFGSIITGLNLDNSYVWFIIFFLLSIFSFIALVPLAEMQYQFSQTDLSVGYNYLPMSMFINNNIILFITIYIVTVGLTLYTKLRRQ